MTRAVQVSLYAVLLVATAPAFAQTSDAGTSPKKHTFRGLADPADTARKRSSGMARQQASKSVADQTVRDQSGRITQIFEPDASGKLTVETDFEYYETGKLKAINQLGAPGDPVRSRTFTYDANGSLSSQTSPEQGKTALTIDQNNLIHSMTDARGLTKNYVYDSKQRLQRKTYSDGSPTAYFRYRSKKRRMFLAYFGDRGAQDLQKVERYNKAGALDGTLQKYTDGSYATGRVRYDAEGRITGIIYPDGRKIYQTWAPKGRLTSIKEGDLVYFGDTTYANGDDLLTATLTAGLSLRKAYDASGRLSELSVLQASQVLFGHRYHYNA